MLDPFRRARNRYPGQFWLMFVGMLISTFGASMIWPFLMIYVSERLVLPLSTVAGLMALNSAVGLVASFVAGPVVDRLGRKWVMVISLAANGLGYVGLAGAHTLPAFALLMTLTGAVNPLYRVGADAMMADLIPPSRRVDAYSLLRMGHNVGVALGPAIGGFVATASYTIAFAVAALGMITYSLLLALFARETMPQADGEAQLTESGPDAKQRFGGYGRILRDAPFMYFNVAFTLTQVCAATIWVLLAVYAKTHFQVPENLYGLLPTTNAIMVVTLQVWMTQRIKRHRPLPVLALGTLLYAVAVGSIAFGRGFWSFWLSMVVLTVGELMLVPTATTYAANLAPATMRGRYMSIFGLTWGIASGISPVFGGLLNDHFGPTWTWYGGSLVGLVSVLSFLVLARRFPAPTPAEGVEAVPTPAAPA